MTFKNKLNPLKALPGSTRQRLLFQCVIMLTYSTNSIAGVKSVGSVSEKEDGDAEFTHIRSGGILLLVFSCRCVLLVQCSPRSRAITDSESQTGLGGMNSIVGTVFAPSGRPLESRVRIRLSTMTRGDRVFTTNQNGNFAFRGLPAGSYTVIDR